MSTPPSAATPASAPEAPAAAEAELAPPGAVDGAIGASPAPVSHAANVTAPAAAKSAPPPPSSTGSTSSTTSTTSTAKKGEADNPDVLVVYDGNVSMMVGDPAKVSTTLERIVDVAESLGGHLAGRRDGSVSVRVPSARFHEAFDKITALGDVTHQSVTAEDVSEEYHDAQVRLQNLKSTQKRLQEFLAHSASMSDMLTVEHELERVSMEIDRIEGRMRFLRDHAAFSTLSVAVMAPPKSQPIVVSGTKVLPASPRILPLHAEWLDELGVQTLVSN